MRSKVASILAAGTYDLMWFDIVDGDVVNEGGVEVGSGSPD